MVNKNLFNAAVLGLGLTFGYSSAYAQEGQESGGLIAESVDNPSADPDCPTCPPKVQVNVNPPPAPVAPPTEEAKPGKGRGKFVPKGGCTTLFEGNGRCISRKEAKLGGFTVYERGYCPGKDFCYNTTKPVVEEKKVESQLETVVQQEAPAVLPINPEYFKPFSGCDTENTQRESLLHKYEGSKAGCESARKKLDAYLKDTLPAPAEGATPSDGAAKTPEQSQNAILEALAGGPKPSLAVEAAGENAEKKETFNAETAKTLEAEVTRLCGEREANEQALKDYMTFVKEHGCNYKEPKAERGVEFDAATRGTYDGAWGAQVDAALLLPVGQRAHIGIYANGTIPETGVETTTTHPEKDLDGFTQTETRKVDRVRHAGLGAQLGYDLAPWLRVYLRGGAALTEKKTHRTIDILGDQKTVNGEDKSLRLEGGAGVQLGTKHFYVPFEFHYNDTTGAGGSTGAGVRF